ncbi:MAG: M56 family metallopeptidase [Planctomycetes bacterium]|nr:M56 family metallopeptidase [Planctomycetota bacterium]
MMPALTATNLVAYALQIAALVAVGAGLPVVFRLRSPRARLTYWRALLVVCLALPLVQPLLPAPTPDIQPAAAAGASLSATLTGGPAVPRVPAGSGAPPPAPPGPWPLDQIVAIILLLGIAARFIWLGVGLVSLRRLRRCATPLDPRPSTVEDACLLTGADAEFRITAAIARPVTFGAARPVVVVPDEFNALGEQQQKAVACHELVHVRRHDWLKTIGDEVVRSVFWFHPALWWLLDQIHLALEQVVDQEVVEITDARQPYLDALLRLAAPAPRVSLRPASLFIRRSHLRERVTLLLKEVSMSRSRLVASFLTMGVVLFVSGKLVVSAFPLRGLVSVAVQAVQSIQETEATPAAAAVAKPRSVQAGQAQGSKRPGEPTPQPLPPRASGVPAKIHDVRPIYPAEARRLGVAGTVLLRITVDATGSVSEASVLKGDSALWGAATDAVRQWRFQVPQTVPYVTVVAVSVVPLESASAPTQKRVRVGGTIRPPVKVKDTRPVYPDDARQAGVQGVVILEATIDPSGIVIDARVLRSIPPLDAAAIDAVMQWRFEPKPEYPPLLMTVTVNFKLDAGPKTTGVAGGVVGGTSGGVSGDVAGGVAGGVPGGVTGGVVGGVPGGVGAAPRGGIAAPPDAVRVGDHVKAPAKIKDVRPVYPEVAREAGIQGVVIVEVLIGTDGTVQGVKILRSIPLLDQAALDAVRQWEFEPTIIDGQPRPVVATLTVNFMLQ